MSEDEKEKTLPTPDPVRERLPEAEKKKLTESTKRLKE